MNISNILNRYPVIISAVLVLIIAGLFTAEMIFFGLLPVYDKWLPIIPVLSATLVTILFFKKIRKSLRDDQSRIIMFGWAELILYVSILMTVIPMHSPNMIKTNFLQDHLFRVLFFSFYGMIYVNVILLPQIVILIFILRPHLKRINFRD